MRTMIFFLGIFLSLVSAADGYAMEDKILIQADQRPSEQSKAMDATINEPPQTNSSSTNTTQNGSAWNLSYYRPVIKLIGIAIAMGLFLWWIDLPTLMPKESWTDRTVIALVIVLAFVAAIFLDVNEKALGALKDVTLIVVGFYFGTAGKSPEINTKPDPTALPDQKPLKP